MTRKVASVNDEEGCRVGYTSPSAGDLVKNKFGEKRQVFGFLLRDHVTGFE